MGDSEERVSEDVVDPSGILCRTREMVASDLIGKDSTNVEARRFRVTPVLLLSSNRQPRYIAELKPDPRVQKSLESQSSTFFVPIGPQSGLSFPLKPCTILANHHPPECY